MTIGCAGVALCAPRYLRSDSEALYQLSYPGTVVEMHRHSYALRKMAIKDTSFADAHSSGVSNAGWATDAYA
jgi:hypothetical protein